MADQASAFAAWSLRILISRLVELSPASRWGAPNQPLERTPPCCALRRRSTARWADTRKQVQV
jgi:hypothetical protein